MVLAAGYTKRRDLLISSQIQKKIEQSYFNLYRKTFIMIYVCDYTYTCYSTQVSSHFALLATLKVQLSKCPEDWLIDEWMDG